MSEKAFIGELLLTVWLQFRDWIFPRNVDFNFQYLLTSASCKEPLKQQRPLFKLRKLALKTKRKIKLKSYSLACN